MKSLVRYLGSYFALTVLVSTSALGQEAESSSSLEQTIPGVVDGVPGLERPPLGTPPPIEDIAGIFGEFVGTTLRERIKEIERSRESEARREFESNWMMCERGKRDLELAIPWEMTFSMDAYADFFRDFDHAARHKLELPNENDYPAIQTQKYIRDQLIMPYSGCDAVVRGCLALNFGEFLQDPWCPAFNYVCAEHLGGLREPLPCTVGTWLDPLYPERVH